MAELVAALSVGANVSQILSFCKEVILDLIIPRLGGQSQTNSLANLLLVLEETERLLDEVEYDELTKCGELIINLKDGVSEAEDTLEEILGGKYFRGTPSAYNKQVPSLSTVLGSLSDTEKKLESLNKRLKEFRGGGSSSSSTSDDNANLRASWRVYRHLPANLKRCFVLFSIFPRSHSFNKHDLVHLWMAENLIRYDRMMKIPKVDIGISYLDEMKNKSIISESEDSCQISDAFHELAKFVSGKECVTINDGDDKTNSHVTSSLRHLSFYCQDNMSKGFVLQGTCEDLDRCDNLATCKGLRTLLLQTARSSRISEISFKKITNFKRLRVLDISFTSITEVSELIGCLVLLQYLNLSKSGIRKLPKTIQKLGRLLILKLNDCRNLKNLPCLEGLCSLQLLLLNKNHYLDSMPPGIGQLTSLETFSCPFVVGKGNEDKIGVLKEMNNLRGSLCISKLENVLNFREASEAALGDKEFLHQLKLKWSVDSFGECKNFQEVLGGLIPHKNLKILKISGYDDQYFPDWVTRETFENLEKVSLSECKKCELLPPLWRLPLLKSLSIIAMEIRQFNNKFFFEIGSGSGFSSLEILQVKEMPNLTCWIIEQGDNIECHPFPKLKELTFVDCPNLRNLEVLQRIESLRLLKIKNCPLNEWMEQQLGWHRGMLDDASMIQNYHRNVEESQEP